MKFYELLKKQNITQNELAKVLNLRQQTISNYCTGTREPKLKTLIKLSKILKTPAEELIKILLETGGEKNESK